MNTLAGRIVDGKHVATRLADAGIVLNNDRPDVVIQRAGSESVVIHAITTATMPDGRRQCFHSVEAFPWDLFISQAKEKNWRVGINSARYDFRWLAATGGGHFDLRPLDKVHAKRTKAKK